MISLSKQGSYFIKPALIIILSISSTLNFFGQTKDLKPAQKYPADSLRLWTSGLMDEISKSTLDSTDIQTGKNLDF